MVFTDAALVYVLTRVPQLLACFFVIPYDEKISKGWHKKNYPFSNGISFSSNHNTAIISHDLYREDQVEEKEAQLRSFTSDLNETVLQFEYYCKLGTWGLP